MSAYFVMNVDADVTIEHAEDVKASVLAVFRDKGIIAGVANDDSVEDGERYFPGPACQDLYKPAEGKHEFWNMTNPSVEPRVGRDFNCWALGPSFEGSTCPACGVEFAPDDKEVFAILIDAIVESVKQSGPAIITCPSCKKDVQVAEWQCKPPHGIGNLAFTFWNWPPLDSAGWRIDIPGLVRQLTGHRIVCTYGRF
jgi:hypothetical protein